MIEVEVEELLQAGGWMTGGAEDQRQGSEVSALWDDVSSARGTKFDIDIKLWMMAIKLVFAWTPR